MLAIRKLREKLPHSPRLSLQLAVGPIGELHSQQHRLVYVSLREVRCLDY